MAWSFELVAGPYGGATDGPVWDGQGVLFSNQAEESIMRYDPASGQVRVVRPYWIRVKGLALAPDGTLYGCQSGSRRIVRFNADGSASPLPARLDGEMINCPDDLAVDRQGRIWFSDPYDPVPPRGPDLRPFLTHTSVLRLDPAGDGWRLQRMTFDTRCPRGVRLAPDERTLYVAESNEEPAAARRELRAYPILADGTLGTARVLHAFGVDERGIDGMCLDRDGNLVAAVGMVYGPGAIMVFAPGGGVLATHPLPEDQPTSCAFGDPDGASLYVTTVGGRLYRARDRA